MKLIKGTDCSVKFRVYDDIIARIPINISDYNEIICAVTENYGRLLIEKKFSLNHINKLSDDKAEYPYIIQVMFTKEDTQFLSVNPSYEERQRTLELFGIDVNEQVTRFLTTDFYLEGSGYYVHRNRR